jgi:hypothetical protein
MPRWHRAEEAKQVSFQHEEGSASRIAARNNAEWCDILCRTHGISGTFDADAWAAPRRTPPFYPDAVTLDPAADEASILERIDTVAPDCSIKDSFATLDLAPFGFELVHEAEWIYRDPQAAPSAGDPRARWRPVEDDAELVAWEAAWDVDGADLGLFTPELLSDPSVTILGGYAGTSIVAGAIVNRTGEVVGVSNLFAADGNVDDAWIGCLGYLDRAFAGSAVVGYESGDELAAAQRHGFRSVGRLRVWLKGR